MSDTTIDKVDDFLEHYGVKGMRWGTRRGRRGTSGYSKDAKTAVGIRRKAKTSPVKVKALSNQEIETYLRRVSLEARYSDVHPRIGRRALNTVKSILGVGRTVNEAAKFAASPAGQAVRSGLEKKRRSQNGQDSES